MKRILAVLAVSVLCLGADEGAIPGWKLRSGDWMPIKSGFSGTGWIYCDKELSDFDLSFTLTVNKAEPNAAFVISFSALPNGEPPRYYLTFGDKKPTGLVLSRHGESPIPILGTATLPVPLAQAKKLPIQVKKKGGAILVIVGRRVCIDVKNAKELEGKLLFIRTSANVSCENVSVKELSDK